MGLIRYAVSACLAGQCCRYDGGSNPLPAVKALVARGEAVPLCPEQLAGLPIPRPPCEICGNAVISRDGQDLSAAFAQGADAALAAALEHKCTHAILKARSPSCGVGELYDGSFSKTLIPGHGLWAARLQAAGVLLYTEETWKVPK